MFHSFFFFYNYWFSNKTFEKIIFYLQNKKALLFMIICVRCHVNGFFLLLTYARLLATSIFLEHINVSIFSLIASYF